MIGGESVSERKKKPDNDAGSGGELNGLSSEGNDMKPVIYWRFGGRDQNTNYTIAFALSALSSALWEA